jgi:hypothetical protein
MEMMSESEEMMSDEEDFDEDNPDANFLGGSIRSTSFLSMKTYFSFLFTFPAVNSFRMTKKLKYSNPY